jgi:hypothetical protein
VEQSARGSGWVVNVRTEIKSAAIKRDKDRIDSEFHLPLRSDPRRADARRFAQRLLRALGHRAERTAPEYVTLIALAPRLIRKTIRRFVQSIAMSVSALSKSAFKALLKLDDGLNHLEQVTERAIL